MKTSTIAWTLIVLVVIIGGVWYLMSSAATNTSVPSTSTTDATGQVATPSGQTTDQTQTQQTPTVPTGATVTYDGSSFSPSSVTIAKGGTVTFVDNSSNPMWVASNPHPTHEGYDGTTRSQHCAAGYNGTAPFDQCSPGTSFSFTFGKAGSWGYHDHLNHSAQGTVTVQ